MDWYRTGTGHAFGAVGRIEQWLVGMELNDKDRRSKRGRLRLFACLLLAGVLLNAGPGCSASSRHRLLTIVFTGVPPLEGAAPEGKEGMTDEQPRDMTQEERQQQYRQALRTTFWVHGPYGAGECERCHNLSQSTNFQGDAVAVNRDPFTSGPGVFGSRLAVPKDQLCISCHSSHSASFADQHSLTIHAPSAAGECTACHHPHQARRRFMLLGTDNRELCGRCHNPNRPEMSQIHTSSQTADCLECHNAHMGTSALLLKENDKELALLYHSDDYAEDNNQNQAN